MTALLRGSLVVLLLCTPLSFAGSGKYTIKTATKAPPKELAAAVGETLDNQTIELYQDGKLAAEVWLCKSIPGQVAAAKAGKTVTYRDLKETSLFGAVKFHSEWGDYRKQKINPGVYTLRLGFQPQDGDHMGTAPFSEFVILTAAKLDTKTDLLPPKTLIERSSSSINTTHPAVLLLFPNPGTMDKAELAAKPNNTWVLNLKHAVATDNKASANLGIGLAIVGHAAE
jgi:hypothetical protein